MQCLLDGISSTEYTPTLVSTGSRLNSVSLSYDFALEESMNNGISDIILYILFHFFSFHFTLILPSWIRGIVYFSIQLNGVFNEH